MQNLDIYHNCVKQALIKTGGNYLMDKLTRYQQIITLENILVLL